MDETSSSVYSQKYCGNALTKKIEFYRHSLDESDKKQILQVLDSIFLTTGDIVSTFEKKLSDYTKNKFSVGLMSCTHGLDLSLRYFNIGQGDEVITTPMSFIATANVIEHVGAKPVFVDVERKTGNIDATQIEKAITKKTKAIMPVHLYGQMCDIITIKKIADKYNLKIIEDAAHCLEGQRDGFYVGQLSDAACYSFYATKNLTCGEGGAITTNNEAMYNWLCQARLHGMTKDAASRYTEKYRHYDVKFAGFKANMSNLSAALLINQINRLDELLERRNNIARMYDSALRELEAIKFPQVLKNSRHGRHLYTIWIEPEMRDKIINYLQEQRVGVAVNFRPIHLMSYYKEKYGFEEGDFPLTEEIGSSTISLPFYPRLKEEEIEHVVETLKESVKNK